MADYGVLSGIVATSGSLIAAGSAIRLGWMQRAKWMPPEEAVAGGTTKISSLICAVVIGLLWAARLKIGFMAFCWIAGVCLGVTVIALVASATINLVYSFESHPPGKRATRVLGGFWLTPEAKGILDKRNLRGQELFSNANFKPDLVWGELSRALVQVSSILGFIALQASGSIALAATALAISLS